MAVEQMNLSLSPRMARFIRGKVKNGEDTNMSEDEAIKSARTRHRLRSQPDERRAGRHAARCAARDQRHRGRPLSRVQCRWSEEPGERPGCRLRQEACWPFDGQMRFNYKLSRSAKRNAHEISGYLGG